VLDCARQFDSHHRNAVTFDLVLIDKDFKVVGLRNFIRRLPGHTTDLSG